MYAIYLFEKDGSRVWQCSADSSENALMALETQRDHFPASDFRLV